MSKFAQLIKKTTAGNSDVDVNSLVESLESIITQEGLLASNVADVVGMEHLDEVSSNTLATAFEGLAQSVQQVAAQHNVDLTPAMHAAATSAGIIATNPRSFYAKGRAVVPNTGIVMEGYNLDTGIVGTEDVLPSMEAFDNTEQKRAAVYSMIINMTEARQDEFGEALFPTITVSPDESGFMVEYPEMVVYRSIDHQTNGKLVDFKKRNLIHAFRDSSILASNKTKLIPVLRAGTNDSFFTSNSAIPSTTVDVDGETITTKPLAPGKEGNLLGLSQTDSLIARGLMDETDSIDPSVRLSKIYIRIKPDGDANAKVIAYNVENLAKANFTYSTQGDSRETTLAFETNDLTLTADKTDITGATIPDATLTGLVSKNLKARLRVKMFGSLNLQTGNYSITAMAPAIDSVRSASDDNLPLDSGDGGALVTSFAGSEIVGFELEAYRTNSNLRTVDRIIDTDYKTYIYPIKAHPQVTAISPISNNDAKSDLLPIMMGVRAYTANSAVTTLLNVDKQLSEWRAVKNAAGELPRFTGAGSMLVNAYYGSDTLDMATIVDSENSTNRASDIQMALVNKIRNVVFDMYAAANMDAALYAMYGTNAVKVTAIVATDTATARWIMLDTDGLMLGNNIDLRVVSTTDDRMTGKLFITFGIFDGNENTRPNPLHFGNMAWRPEITSVAAITRQGATRRETNIRPFFTHVHNLPVLYKFTVTNMAAVTNKVPEYVHNV